MEAGPLAVTDCSDDCFLELAATEEVLAGEHYLSGVPRYIGPGCDPLNRATARQKRDRETRCAARRTIRRAQEKLAQLESSSAA